MVTEPTMASAPIFAKSRRRAELVDGLRKHSPALADASADLFAALEDLSCRRRSMFVPDLWNDGIAGGAQHRGVSGINAERVYR